MILSPDDKRELEWCRASDPPGVMFLAKILCKIVAYLESREERERREARRERVRRGHVW